MPHVTASTYSLTDVVTDLLAYLEWMDGQIANNLQLAKGAASAPSSVSCGPKLVSIVHLTAGLERESAPNSVVKVEVKVSFPHLPSSNVTMLMETLKTNFISPTKHIGCHLHKP